MPYPTQIDPAATVELARQLIEREGYEAVSLNRLATALNVKAPSLYRHFASKADLIRAVNLLTNTDLIAALHAAFGQAGGSVIERLDAMAAAYRAFALTHPRTYMLAFSALNEDMRIDPQAAEALAIPLQQVLAELVGAERSLPALRGLWALLHGFVSLEIDGQFRRSGDLDAAFAQSVHAYLAGWSG